MSNRWNKRGGLDRRRTRKAVLARKWAFVHEALVVEAGR